MPTTSITQLQQIMQGQFLAPAFGLPCRWNETFDVSIDSRTLQQGDLFFAIQGKQHDGHAFLPEAIRNGASAVVIDQDLNYSLTVPAFRVNNTSSALQQLASWHRSQFDPLVIGVTGTAGKTTTRELLHHLLSVSFKGCRSPHNYNNQWGVPLSLLQLTEQDEYAIIELAASQPGDITQGTSWAKPEIGLITSIGLAHLEGMRSLEGVLTTKAELFDALPPEGIAVLPVKSQFHQQLTQHCRCRVIRIGETEASDYRLSDICCQSDRIHFCINSIPFHFINAGLPLVECAAQAIAICCEIGIDLSVLSQRLESFRPVAGRGEQLSIGSWRIIDETYNANPLSMTAALQSLATHNSESTTIAIIGEMAELADLTTQCHQQIGREVALSSIDYLAIWGPHSKDVAAGAIAAGMPVGNVFPANDWDVFTSVIQCWLEPQATVMIKGSRSQQMERMIPILNNWAKDLHLEIPQIIRRAA